MHYKQIQKEKIVMESQVDYLTAELARIEAQLTEKDKYQRLINRTGSPVKELSRSSSVQHCPTTIATQLVTQDSYQ